ncbi:MAG: transporter substrate-binding domain-containing protein, partial [Pseudorhodoplanes sp.]
MFSIVRGILAALVIAICALQGAQAQPATQEVRVVTRVLPPMVIDRNGQLTGFSIELWNRIAERLQVRTTYEVAPDVRALLDQIRTGKAD